MNPLQNRRPGILRNLTVDRVDLVDKGGNQRADIRLMKREQPADGPGARDPSLEGGSVTPNQQQGFLAGLIHGIGKTLGWTPAQIQKAADESQTFTEVQTRREIDEEVYDMIWALRESFSSILQDPTADKGALMRGSLDQFQAAIEAAVPKWTKGQTAFEKAGRAIAMDRMNRLKQALAHLQGVIQEADQAIAQQDGADQTQQPNPTDPTGAPGVAPDPAMAAPGPGQQAPPPGGGEDQQAPGVVPKAPANKVPGAPPNPAALGIAPPNPAAPPVPPHPAAPPAAPPKPGVPGVPAPAPAVPGAHPPAPGPQPQPQPLVPGPKKPPFGKGVDFMLNRPNLTGVTAEVVKYLEALEAANTPAPSTETEVAKALTDLGPDHPITKRLVALEAESKASTELVKRLEDQQQVAQYVTLVKSLDALVAGDQVDTIGAVLKSVAGSVDADTFGKLQTLLKGADAQLRQGDLFVEKGRGGGSGAGSAEGKLNAAAIEIQKADKGSYPDAFMKAMDQHPELYAQYLAENPAQKGGR